MACTRLESPGELGLFLADHFEDPLALFGQVRVGVLHHVDDDASGDVDERITAAEKAAVAHRTAQDPAQYVAATLVGGRDAVRH